MVYNQPPISDNLTSAGNQQGSSLGKGNPSETTRRTPQQSEFKAYLLGALHDGTYNALHRTFRFTQSNIQWLQRLQHMLARLGYASWIYREGKQRHVYALETTAAFLDIHFDPLLLKTKYEQLAYIRGYFDAEGGIPRSLVASLYIQLCQKNHLELTKVKRLLENNGIRCGRIHNPSSRVDPLYWRFYISRGAHYDFMEKVSSWHPRKEKLFTQRMKI